MSSVVADEEEMLVRAKLLLVNVMKPLQLGPICPAMPLLLEHSPATWGIPWDDHRSTTTQVFFAGARTVLVDSKTHLGRRGNFTVKNHSAERKPNAVFILKTYSNQTKMGAGVKK